MRPLLLALPVLLACSGSPEWTSSAEGSLCTLDLVGHSVGVNQVDVVLVVDDSPSAAASRPMFRAQAMAALRQLVIERPFDGFSNHVTAHDLHVSIRGVSTVYERRVAYLARTPDNAWADVHDELRDAEAFLAACDHALEELPTGIEETPFITRIADLRRGDGWIRPQSRVLLFFATAHDDSGPEAERWLEDLDAWDGHEPLYAVNVAISVLVDQRALGPEAPSAAGKCGLFYARDGSLEAAPPSVPRLVAQMKSRLLSDGQLALVCSGHEDLTGLLVNSAVLFYWQCLSARLADAECTVLVAPPVSGDETLCARPDLGLAPASAEARRYAASRESAPELAGRPLCQMTRRTTCDGTAGEGFCWPQGGSCGLQFTDWATPVSGSYVLLHCASQRCGGGG